jgi:uncharacterized membrane protein YeaQ/YmgE (transglycosylase-associated protein family)
VTGILAWIVLGLIVGLVARVLSPRDDPGGVVLTTSIGILGALIGGFIASAFGLGSAGQFFDPETWLIAVVGALLLLLNYRAIAGRGSA